MYSRELVMRVGIVISNYNGWADTVRCLNSLRKQTYRDFRIYLIDDASTDDSVEHLQTALQPQDVLLMQKQNLGFAAANNSGIRRALEDGVEAVLLLNNDTVCAPDMLELLLQETPPGAVSCPKMLFMEPPDEIWFAGGTLNPRTATVTHEGGHAKDGPAYSQKKQVSFITFCCVLLPRTVIEPVGYLDESLFMYCEDVDYCIRLTNAGVPLWYIPLAKLWHRAGGTAGGMLSVYYITRNTLYLRCRGRSKAYRWALGCKELFLGGVSCTMAALLGHHYGRSYGRWRGAVDFMKGETGKKPPQGKSPL